jgi:hypothetical protein
MGMLRLPGQAQNGQGNLVEFVKIPRPLRLGMLLESDVQVRKPGSPLLRDEECGGRHDGGNDEAPT